jgi:PAS domain S-box-containing protein
LVTELDSILGQVTDTQKDFLAAVIRALPVAVFCKDYAELPGKFVAWNKAAEKLWGLDSADVIGKSDFDFFPKEQAEYFQTLDLETLYATDMLFIPEEAVDSPSVGRRYVKTWKVAVHENDGRPRYLLGISLDITESKQLSDRLAEERQRATLSAKLASIGEMAGGVAHEINNPLTIILGQIELFKTTISRGETDPANMITAIEKMQQNVTRIARIVDGLLKFARDGAQNAKRDSSVNQMVRDSLSLCDQQVRNHGIDLSVKLLEVDLQIYCREIEISQILMNLVNNSRAAVSRKSGAWIKIEVSADEDFIEFSVSDSGRRPSEEVASRLFTPFFTTKPAGQGTGLGLSISKGLIESHGGSIWLDQNSATTRFVFRLPRVTAAMIGFKEAA